LDAAVMLADYFMRLFKNRSGRSGFCITASLSSFLLVPKMTMYTTSKSGLAGFGSALYAEYKH